MKCPECEEEVSARAETCPHCGFPIPTPYGFMIFIILFLWAILIGIMYFFSDWFY